MYSRSQHSEEFRTKFIRHHEGKPFLATRNFQQVQQSPSLHPITPRPPSPSSLLTAMPAAPKAKNTGQGLKPATKVKALKVDVASKGDGATNRKVNTRAQKGDNTTHVELKEAPKKRKRRNAEEMAATRREEEAAAMAKEHEHEASVHCVADLETTITIEDTANELTPRPIRNLRPLVRTESYAQVPLSDDSGGIAMGDDASAPTSEFHADPEEGGDTDVEEVVLPPTKKARVNKRAAKTIIEPKAKETSSTTVNQLPPKTKKMWEKTEIRTAINAQRMKMAKALGAPEDRRKLNVPRATGADQAKR